MRNADIIAIPESTMACVLREAVPPGDAAREAVEAQQKILDDLKRVLEDAVDDALVRRMLLRHVDAANDAGWILPYLVDGIYSDTREDIRSLRALVTDLRLEQNMGRAWTEGADKPRSSDRPRVRSRRFGLTWTAFGHSWSLTLSAGINAEPERRAGRAR